MKYKLTMPNYIDRNIEMLFRYVFQNNININIFMLLVRYRNVPSPDDNQGHFDHAEEIVTGPLMPCTLSVSIWSSIRGSLWYYICIVSQLFTTLNTFAINICHTPVKSYSNISKHQHFQSFSNTTSVFLERIFHSMLITFLNEGSCLMIDYNIQIVFGAIA